jgi:hypothetical protein
MRQLVGAFGIALVVAMLMVGGSAHAAPRAAEPATEDANAVLNPPNFLALEAQLADYDERATVATGSTAGFPADPRLIPGYSVDNAAVPTAPGATGWWIFFAQSGSTYTIDNCGSAFQAQLTVYEVDGNDLTVKDASTDGCADPVTAQFSHWWGGAVKPLVLRIDDATGAGGNYVVNYSRTTVDPVSEIRKVKVGYFKSAGWRKRREPGRTEVSIKMYWQAEGPRTRIKCSLDGGEPVDCLSRPTFDNVRAGKHEVTATVTNSLGQTASDTTTFRVSRKELPRR